MRNTPTTLQEVLDRHRLTQRDVALGAGIALSAVSDIATGKRNPRTDTVNRLLTYLRQFDPELTYELLFAATETPEAGSIEATA